MTTAVAETRTIPETDGLRADSITVRFVGVVTLDRENMEDLAFVEASVKPAPGARLREWAVLGSNQ